MTCRTHRWLAEPFDAGRFGAGNACASIGGKAKQTESSRHDLPAIPRCACHRDRGADPVNRLGAR